MSINNPQLASNYGNYSGNDTATRAIPHGLGTVPTTVIIRAPVSGLIFIYTRGYGSYTLGNGTDQTVVNTPTIVNFYVGNATSYPNSANASGITYYWTAIP